MGRADGEVGDDEGADVAGCREGAGVGLGVGAPA